MSNEHVNAVFADALEALKEPHSIKLLHFINAPRDGVCNVTGYFIHYGEPCIEKITQGGVKSWYSAKSDQFKWWVKKHTKLDLDRCLKGLCNHGLLSTCKECSEITPGWTESPQTTQ